MMRVIIVRTHGYSGGSLVLDTMCSCFRKKGVDASLFFIHREPKKNTGFLIFWLKWTFYSFKWDFFHSLCCLFPHANGKRFREWRPVVNSPVKGIKRKRLPFFSKKNTIVIYPEKVYGNFLHARNVTRYLLFHYDYTDDKNAYGKDDLFVAYREVFDVPTLNPEGFIAPFAHFDKELYRQYNYGERKGNCYIIRKGRDRKDLPKQLEGPVIDNQSEEEKVRTLNRCERCYLYDTQTFYGAIAAVCGCLPIIVMEPGKKKEDYIGEDDRPLGIAYGDTSEEIDYALRTREQLLKKLDFTEFNERNITTLISILKAKFNPMVSS